mgnify:CR=1 FL=1
MQLELLKLRRTYKDHYQDKFTWSQFVAIVDSVV